MGLKVAHCSDLECSVATLTTIDGTYFIWPYTSIAIGSDGLGLISYPDANYQDVRVAHCLDVACTAATTATIDSETGEYTSITLSAEGFGLISYWGGADIDLRVAQCTDLACTAATLTTVDSTGSFFEPYTSITIGSDGLGLVSYTGGATDALKVAHLSNVPGPSPSGGAASGSTTGCGECIHR